MRPLSLGLLLAAALASPAAARTPHSIAVPLPGGEDGAGFGDVAYAPGLRKVLVPGARTGRLFLVDPASRTVQSVEGFSRDKSYDGAHGAGTTSADEAKGAVLAIDRTAVTLSVVDLETRRIVVSTALAAAPDYVRYVASSTEAWVTEPDQERIEIFSLAADTSAPLAHSAFILVEGGPEGLAIDAKRGRAYTNLWNGMTVALDLRTHVTAARWPNGCKDTRSLALDTTSGLLLVACAEGKLVALDAARDGRMLAIADAAGKGADAVAWSPSLRRAYVAAANEGTLTAFDVSPQGRLTAAWSAHPGGHCRCVAADERGGVWACDPDRGRLLYYKDSK